MDMGKPVEILDMKLSEDGTKLLGVIRATKEIAQDLGVKPRQKVECTLIDSSSCNFGCVISKSALAGIVEDWKDQKAKEAKGKLSKRLQSWLATFDKNIKDHPYPEDKPKLQKIRDLVKRGRKDSAWEYIEQLGDSIIEDSIPRSLFYYLKGVKKK